MRLLVSALFFCLNVGINSEEHFRKSNVLLENVKEAVDDFVENFHPNLDILHQEKFDLDLTNAFNPDHKNSRVKRSCPSGVGNLGFNSFNFLTFMVMLFNAIANTNNNINNNNNNDNDINVNSITMV